MARAGRALGGRTRPWKRGSTTAPVISLSLVLASGMIKLLRPRAQVTPSISTMTERQLRELAGRRDKPRSRPSWAGMLRVGPDFAEQSDDLLRTGLGRPT
jgi:hypothetical protein